MRALKLLATIAITVVIQACSTSKAVVSHNIDLSKYSYVVFGKETSGDRELDDIIMTVQNEIAATKLAVVSAQDGLAKIAIGEFVLSPNIHVSTEKWDGGHTYITITFYDYDTRQSVVILKSSGIGLSISQDQNIALRAIRKKLKKVFGEKSILLK
ncbi:MULTISPECIES: hypothetical protein [Bacteroidales]|jgi:hypothetical protein|uniref:hypothetical protein n=1 Tax=Bacteroidales TaxID=171549 RepID=UPI00259C80FA|nr:MULTISPECIES: hypothetical protein [Bacteroidales]